MTFLSIVLLTQKTTPCLCFEILHIVYICFNECENMINNYLKQNIQCGCFLSGDLTADLQIRFCYNWKLKSYMQFRKHEKLIKEMKTTLQCLCDDASQNA